MAKVEIEVTGELLEDLSRGFFWEQYTPSADKGDKPVARLIVARVNGLKIKIWADEHPPPHFHVSYQGEDASFSIGDCGRLSGVRGLERYEKRIQLWWEDNRHLLIEKWNSSRPSDCPVGAMSAPTKVRRRASFQELESEMETLLSSSSKKQ
jgi:hypothetical protein